MQAQLRYGKLAGTVAVSLLLIVASFSLFAITRPSVHAATTSSGFVKHSGSGLTLNGAPFRFAGANIYWLGGTGVESGVSYNQQVTNILQIVSANPPNGMSETVVRASGMGTDIGCGNNTCIEPTLNNIPQNSAAFQRMDYTIWQAGQDNIRLDIPFVDYWNYGPGGIDTWLSWHGYPIVRDSSGNPAVDGSADYGPFWTDATIIHDFETYISAFLNHVNSITGVAYKNDPTIMAWELGNELDSAPTSWDTTIANYIKSIDANHLVSFDSRFGLQNNHSLGVASIDLEQGHYYPMSVSGVINDAKTANSNGKAYYVGEYGWDSGTPADLSAFDAALEATNQGYLISGDTYWSLFPKDVAHDDGFTLHFPGDTTTMDQEINLLTLHAQVMRSGDVLVPPNGKPTSGAPIGQTIWLKASNGNYVSTRTDQTTLPLQAVATTPQTWEEYTVVDAGNGLIALQAPANGNYVSTRTDQTNAPLEATATSVQAWEEFAWVAEGNGQVALLAEANGDFVSAWQATTNTPLEAVAPQAQAWETFQWGSVGGSTPTPTPTPTKTPTSGAPIGQTIWLKASNGYYVSAWLNDPNSPLEARNATTVQTWEEFTVVDAGNGMIALKAVANGLYVSAWLGDPNTPLEARSATTIQAWEEFTWVSEGNGAVALLASTNGLYVSAWQADANTPLEARATSVQGWETFQWGTI
ncbi:MAG TPA: hypothetical protein VHD63_10225 [Ktedonobacteraceae bacterium]|nr:hypothetical protein [Ktedonobacteraceae bacterium]